MLLKVLDKKKTRLLLRYHRDTLPAIFKFTEPLNRHLGHDEFHLENLG